MAYYVINDNKCLFESMTKEQILAAITQAVSTHEISDVDTGFVTTLKEQNKNGGLKVWVGTSAEYNAIQTKELNCLYILTDDTELEDLEQEIALLWSVLTSIYQRKDEILLNEEIEYGDDYAIALSGETPIEQYSIVKVIAQGAGEILCTVHKDETDNVTIKGCGFANISGTAGATIVNVNLTCSKSQNILKINKSTYNTLLSSSNVFGEQSINKIIGVY